MTYPLICKNMGDLLTFVTFSNVAYFDLINQHRNLNKMCTYTHTTYDTYVNGII